MVVYYVCSSAVLGIPCVTLAYQLSLSPIPQLRSNTMNSPTFPSIFIACPCSDNIGQRVLSGPRKPSSTLETDCAEKEEEEEDAFDPRAARSTFSLFPLENLLFCADCNQVRCPRCVLEEIVCYFCPSCLFEVPSSTVKSEGNRWVPPTSPPPKT